MMARHHALFGLLCLAWLLPGLIAHDPWKPDEAYTFGVVYDPGAAAQHAGARGS